MDKKKGIITCFVVGCEVIAISTLPLAAWVVVTIVMGLLLLCFYGQDIYDLFTGKSENGKLLEQTTPNVNYKLNITLLYHELCEKEFPDQTKAYEFWRQLHLCEHHPHVRASELAAFLDACIVGLEMDKETLSPKDKVAIDRPYRLIMDRLGAHSRKPFYFEDILEDTERQND